MRHAMRKEERELARRLAPEAVEPPEGLLERLKADIPEELPAIDRDRPRGDDGDGGGWGRVLRFPGALTGLSTGAVLKTAAAVVLAVGAGFLALQVQRETPDLQVQEAQEAMGVSAPQEAQNPAGDQEPARDDDAKRPQASKERSEVGRDAGQLPRVPAPESEEELERRKSEIFDRLASLKRRRTEGDTTVFGEGAEAATREEGLGADRAGDEQVFTESVDRLDAPPPVAEPEPLPSVASPPPPSLVPKPKARRTEPKSQKLAPVWVGTDSPITFRGGSPRTEELRERLERLPETDVVFDLPDQAPAPPAAQPAKKLPLPVRDLVIEVRHEEGEGEALPGAVLYLKDASGNERTSVVGPEGRGYFYDVPAGEYQVRAELEGFQAVTRRVTPPEAKDRELALNLPLTVQEEIVVVGEVPEVTETVMSCGTLTVGPETSMPEGTPMPDAFGKRTDRPPVPENPLVDTAYDALSTFGLDVDTGSYGLVRRHLMESTLPPPQTVRIEELLNAFDYGDPAPSHGDFAVTAQGAPSPFRPGLQLLRLGIKARVVTAEDRKPAALTFVVDVSGSMQQPDKLTLAKQALGLLLDQLEPEDTVALVTYGSDAQVVLPHTADKEAVRRAFAELGDGGSTNAEAGLLLGYEEARRAFRPGAVNRIVLCSDGVANVGATDPEALLERVGEEARRGIELTTLGFGMGEYNDHLMEQLADKGDGRYAYLDDLIEAHRVLVEELTGTVQTVAREARVQLELNPGTVKRYRLLGYENRDIADHRFRYDDQDAGEIGSGHAVTVLYELELEPAVPDTAPLAVLRLRWWSVAEDRFVEIEEPVYRRDLVADWDRAAPALRWAALTARFAQALRGQAPMTELPDLADRMHRLTNRAWPGDDRRTELADLARHAAEVHRALLQRAAESEPAEDRQQP